MSQNFPQRIDPKILGSRIRESRRRKGLKQSAFVGELISSGYISLIEQGKRYPSNQALAHIAQILEVPITSLLRPDGPSLKPEQAALLGQAQTLALMMDFQGVQKILANLEPDALTSLSGRILTIEMEYGFGNYNAIEQLAVQIIEDAIHSQNWELARRATNTYTRTLSQLDASLECTIYLGTLRKSLKSLPFVDPFFLGQVTASLASHISRLGDVRTGGALLHELNELLPQITDPRGRATVLWASADVATDTGDYESGISYFMAAKEIFDSEFDFHSSRRLTLSYFATIAQFMPANDPRFAQAESELAKQGTGREDEIYSGAYTQMKIMHAYLLSGLQRYLEAEQILFELLADESLSDCYLADIYLNLGTIKIRTNDQEKAKPYIEKCWAIMRHFEPTRDHRIILLQLAELVEEIGDKDMVIEVLRATHNPVGQFSAFL